MIDYISAILLFSGYILTGAKKKYGWLLSCAGNIGYIYILRDTEYQGLMALSVLMTSVCIYNFIKWK